MKAPLSRRHFLQSLGAFTLASTLPLRLIHAATPGDKRLLVVILRGGMDGLAAVQPVGDKHYADRRGAILLSDAPVDLDGHFALHPSLAEMKPWFDDKELLILHAATTPYRERSHFEAQDMLENGCVTPGGADTGWLNRALLALRSASPGLAIGPTIPLLLRGQAKVVSWAPSILPDVDSDFLSRVTQMYQRDAMLQDALAEAQVMREVTGNNKRVIPPEGDTALQAASGGSMMGQGGHSFIMTMKKAAAFLAKPGGPRIGTLDMNGWDTHGGQELKLVKNFPILTKGLAAFKEGMGDAWKDSAVLLVTEFGRTVRANGTNGTDHGTGTAAFLMGGSVAGGRVAGDWPGLDKLYQDRDLVPANDLRALLKAALIGQLGLSEEALNVQVFPGSADVKPMPGLFRAAS